MSKPTFSPVALEYAKNYVEMQAAREQFQTERDRLRDQLRGAARRAVAEQFSGAPTTGVVEQDGKYVAYYLRGKYTAAVEAKIRKERGANRDGLGFGFDASEEDDDDALHFWTHAFFKISRKTRARLLPRLDALADELGPGVRHYLDRFGWTAFRICRIPASSDAFTHERMTEALQPLVEAFETIDAALGNEYRKVWGLGDADSNGSGPSSE